MSSPNPDGKVNGQTVEVTIEGVMSVFQRRTRNMLNEHGIEEPDPEPDGWYEMHDFVGVLTDIKEDVGENALIKIGEATPNNIDWPADIETPTDALTELDNVYDSQHRSAPGSYDAAVLESETVRVTADTPYPCSFDKGLIKGSAKAFGARPVTVEEVSDQCRDDGGAVCVYEVTW